VALDYEVHISRNPYSETIPDEAFRLLVGAAIGARASDIGARFDTGEYERNRMAFVLLDPTAPSGALADDIVLAIALVGSEADFFAPNALAKAFCYRDHGAEGSALMHTQNHRLADGSFRFGGAVEVGGTIVGGSGQTELQDRYQCTLLAADFNYAVAMGRKSWEESHGPGRWYLNEQVADVRFSRIVERVLRG
jgi:hypothetical protein